MDVETIQSVFQRFAGPLYGFSALGGRKDAIDELARNLWLVLLGGPAAEREFWEQMDQSQNDLAESVRECYQQQMKPLVEDDELQQVREHYGIQVKE